MFVAALPPIPVAVNGALLIPLLGIEMVPLTGEPPQHWELSVKLADPPRVTAFWASASRSCARAIATARAAWRVWKLFCSAAAMQGAVAYAWYVSSASGTETLQAITTINSLAITAPLGTGHQSQTAITAVA